MLSSIDFSSGLPRDAESLVQQPPTQPGWAENLLFAVYDPACDIGLWLHLGTVPAEWTMWEDRLLAMLPGDQGLLSLCCYHKTAPERRPAGAVLAFECLEPFRRWRTTFDGFALLSSNAEMVDGLARDGNRKRFRADLEIVCETPVWDAHAAVLAETGKGAMATQSWAHEHYEQLVTVKGTVQYENGEVVDYDGVGWRDHSRGRRDAWEKGWGGHVIMGALFPSGRGWGLSRYWAPDGAITLEGGYIVDGDGILRHVEVETAPRVFDFQFSGERLPAALRWNGGRAAFDVVTHRSMWASMSHSLAVGVDRSINDISYVLNFCRTTWDGEDGWAYVERSDTVSAPTPEPFSL